MFVVGIHWLGSISDKTWESKLGLFRSYVWDDSAISTTGRANLISLKVSEVSFEEQHILLRVTGTVLEKLVTEDSKVYELFVGSDWKNLIPVALTSVLLLVNELVAASPPGSCLLTQHQCC
ncbi:hypothetical protein AKJ16_DCAP08003 [Drosera capensis]